MRLKKLAVLLLTLTFLAVLPVFAATFPLTLNFHTAVLNVSFPTPADSTIGNQGIETTPQQGKTSDGALSYSGNLYSVSTPSDAAFYGVSYVDYTGGSLSSTSDEDALDGALKNSDMSEVPNSRENTQLAGLFARETVGTTATLDSFLRVATNGNRVFLAVVVAEKSAHLSQDEADAYFATINCN